MRQSLTELRFEQRCLQERYATLLEAVKEQRDAHAALAIKQAETAATLATMQCIMEPLITRFVSGADEQRARASAARAREEMTPTRAESMVSDLLDAHSDVTSAVSAATGYAHSSADAARAALGQRT